MKKIIVLLFCFTMLGFSFYGLSTDSYYTQVLMNISLPFIYARLAIAAAFMAYAYVPSLRLYATKAFLGTSGILMICLGIISVGSPTLLGYVDTYILLGDSLILFEGGIIAVIISAELSTHQLNIAVKVSEYLWPPITSTHNDVAITHMASSAYRGASLVRHIENDSMLAGAPKLSVRSYGVVSNAPP